MNEKIAPDMQSCILCDDVRQERNGKFILIGTFDGIAAQQFPVTYPRLFIYTRWCSGEGEFIQTTRIVRPDQEHVLFSGQPIPVKLPSPEASATNIEVFVNVQFTEPGTHWVEIMLDGSMKVRFPIRVSRVQPDQQPPPPF